MDFKGDASTAGPRLPLVVLAEKPSLRHFDAFGLRLAPQRAGKKKSVRTKSLLLTLLNHSEGKVAWVWPGEKSLGLSWFRAL